MCPNSSQALEFWGLRPECVEDIETQAGEDSDACITKSHSSAAQGKALTTFPKGWRCSSFKRQ